MGGPRLCYFACYFTWTSLESPTLAPPRAGTAEKAQDLLHTAGSALFPQEAGQERNTLRPEGGGGGKIRMCIMWPPSVPHTLCRTRHTARGAAAHLYLDTRLAVWPEPV